MKLFFILFLAAVTSCQTINVDLYISPEFVVKSVKPFNGQYLITAYNGKWILSDQPYKVGETIPLFQP